jgi:hypothetical protein
MSGTEPTTVITGRLISSPHRGAEGESVMSVVLTDLLLFICVALFLTGIMIASAILVG